MAAFLLALLDGLEAGVVIVLCYAAICVVWLLAGLTGDAVRWLVRRSAP